MQPTAEQSSPVARQDVETGSDTPGSGLNDSLSHGDDEPVLKYQRMGADLGKLQETPRESVVRMAVHDAYLVREKPRRLVFHEYLLQGIADANRLPHLRRIRRLITSRWRGRVGERCCRLVPITPLT